VLPEEHNSNPEEEYAMTANSKLSRNQMKNLIRHLLHALATEIDLFFSDDDIGILANEDSLFRIFRTGVDWMDRNGQKITDSTAFVYDRIMRCHSEHFTTPFEPTDIRL
jgi:hypothetical protein